MKHSTLGISDFQYRQAFGKLIPQRWLQQAVAATTTVHRRNRILPTYLVLASVIAWFFDASAKLPAISAWLCRRPDDLPSDPAIYQARHRLRWAPLRWLCDRVVRPLAQLACDPSAFYHGRRLLAIDGTILTVADTPANDHTFGRARNQKGRSGYPLIRLVALCEVGTHALLAWVARGYRVAEQALALRLWGSIPAGSLLLGDRNFHCFPLWQAAHEGAWDLLVRVQSGPKFLVDQVLGDGSYLSLVYPQHGKNKKKRGIRVRVITYAHTDVNGVRRVSRLLTSLLDATRHPAEAMLEVYHQRWEQEGVFKEIKTALSGRVTQVRAHTPLGAMQELDGLLLGHYVIRSVIVEVAREKGILAIEISFKGALRVLRTRLAGASKKRAKRSAKGKGQSAKSQGSQRRCWWEEIKQAFGREVLPKRRKRCCPRKKKVTRGAWPVKRKEDKEHPVPTFKIIPPRVP